MYYFKKLKKLVLAVLVMLCVMLFSACSPINLTTKYEDSGKVEVTLTLPTSSLKALDEDSYSSRIDRIYAILSHYIQDVKEACEDKTIQLFSRIYSFPSTISREEKLREIYILNSKFIFEMDISPAQSAYDYTSSTQEITIKGTFSSIYAYIMYFYPDAFMYNEEGNNLTIDKDKISLLTDVPVANSTLEIEEGFLWNTCTQTALPFTYNGGECALLSPLNIELNSYEEGALLIDVVKDALSLGEEEASFIFSFLSPYKRLESNGTLSYKDGYYVHTWQLDSTSTQVKFVRHIANYTSWYILALILGAAFLGGGMLVAFIVNKKKNSLPSAEVITQDDEKIQRGQTDEQEKKEEA